MDGNGVAVGWSDSEGTTENSFDGFCDADSEGEFEIAMVGPDETDGTLDNDGICESKGTGASDGVSDPT